MIWRIIFEYFVLSKWAVAYCLNDKDVEEVRNYIQADDDIFAYCLEKGHNEKMANNIFSDFYYTEYCKNIKNLRK